MEKISVIVNIYYAEKYLDDCLKSIINQTYKNLEIILVDDGSKDNSFNIAQKYAEKDNRIKLFYKENGGLSNARNFALDKATGQYIGFVDCDDTAHPKLFERLYTLIKNNDADIAMVDFLRSDEEEKDYDIKINAYSKDEIFDDIILDKICAHMWDKLFKKELFDDIKFPEGLNFEDLAVFYKIAYNINRFVLSNEKLYYYRVDNVNSITSKKENSNFNAQSIAKIYREKTNFAYAEDLKVKADVLKMAVKYNTDIYRVLKKEHPEDDNLHIIKSYIKVYYNEIMINFKIDPLKKIFSFLIKNDLY